MTPRLFILEGIDSTGKSTLAKFLAKKLGAAYLHASGHRSLYEAMQAHHAGMISDASVNMDNGLHVVMDRNWPSEVVYGSVLRPENEFRYDRIKMIRDLLPLCPTYIYCQVDGDGYRRYLDCHEDHDEWNFHRLKPSQYEVISQQYDELMGNLPEENVITYFMGDWKFKLDGFFDAHIKPRL